MKRNKILLPLVFVLYCIQVYGVFNPQLLNCVLISLSSMDRIEELGEVKEDVDVYISPGTPAETKKHYMKVIKDARARMEKFWGANISTPKIILCTNKRDFQRYGDYNSEGISRLYIFGSYIVINPEGLTEDVIAHELCHAELFERIGYKNDARLPGWFHEGLAMVISGEFEKVYERYRQFFEKPSVMNKLRADLEEYESSSGFYSKSKRLELYYMKAGLEVSNWLKSRNKEEFDLFIRRVSEGEDFSGAYGGY